MKKMDFEFKNQNYVIDEPGSPLRDSAELEKKAGSPPPPRVPEGRKVTLDGTKDSLLSTRNEDGINKSFFTPYSQEYNERDYSKWREKNVEVP
jgi:hypothetical protein